MFVFVFLFWFGLLVVEVDMVVLVLFFFGGGDEVGLMSGSKGFALVEFDGFDFDVEFSFLIR